MALYSAHFCVASAESHQFIVGALLGDFALFYHKNFVSISYGGKFTRSHIPYSFMYSAKNGSAREM